VLAAGPWSAELLASVGLDLPLAVLAPPQLFVAAPALPPGSVPSDLPEPAFVGPEAALIDRLAPAVEPAPIAHPVVLDLEHNVYARCEPDSARTRVGELDYADARPIPSPADFDEAVADAFAARAHAALARRLPAYAGCPESQRQAAMYTVTPDAQPILGRAPGLENLYLAAGFSGHGFKLAPSIGLGLTQLLLGDPVSAFDPAFFAPERFAGGTTHVTGGSFGM